MQSTTQRADVLSPSATAVIFNGNGEVLLQRRADDGTWGIPGGHIEIGESAAQAVVREVKEETGLDVKIVRLVGVYSNPNETTFRYPDGRVVQYVSCCFECEIIGGMMTTTEETLELRYFPADALPDSVRPAHRRRIHDAAQRRDEAFYE